MILDREGVLSMLPKREATGHKGSFGRVLLLCGSRGYTGAAYLSAMGALRSGAGLVFLGVPESIYAIEAVKLNEPVVFPLPDQDGMLSRESEGEILRRLPRMDAVLIGCGLGIGEDTRYLVRSVLERAACPVVADADALTMLASMPEVLVHRSAPTILTPHEGEFLRLGGDLSAGRSAGAGELAKKLNSIVILKGHDSVITDGEQEYINPTGNPGMAVGGSGDLLGGILVSLLGQKVPPLEAAAAACWIHGAAGDKCAEAMGQYAMLPTDMLQELHCFLR